MSYQNTEVFNILGALRGMRNPKESWDRGDSIARWDIEERDGTMIPVECHYIIGPKDMELAQKLILAGTEHAKFMRQIFVTVDITNPLYWWKECDQYKVSTTTNSTSTMHKLADTPITADCFAHDAMDTLGITENIVNLCESLRQTYLKTRSVEIWRALIQTLPESWMQMRTWTGDYATIRAMYHQRKNHKLKEWSEDFVEWVKTLPYAEELITYVG